MGRWTERRALYNEDEDQYDPYLSLDVNEYLIENYPKLSLKQRTAIWSICQEAVDFSVLEIQVNTQVQKYAIKNMSVELPPNEQAMVNLVRQYLATSWEDIPAEDYDDLCSVLLESLDDLVEEYYEDSDEDESDE